MTHLYARDMTHSYAWHDSIICLSIFILKSCCCSQDVSTPVPVRSQILSCWTSKCLSQTATNYRALLRKMTVKIRHPMTLRHPVPVHSRILSCWRSRCFSLWSSLRRSPGYFAVDFWKLRVPSMDSEESAGDFPGRFSTGEPQCTHTHKHLHAYIYIYILEKKKIGIHTLTWIHQKMNTYIPAWNIQKT